MHDPSRFSFFFFVFWGLDYLQMFTMLAIRNDLVVDREGFGVSKGFGLYIRHPFPYSIP